CCRVIPKSINTAKFSPKLHESRNLGGSAWPRFIQLGRLDSNKNQEVTIRAFAQHRKTNLNARLAIVGDGPNMAQLVRLSRDLRLEECIRFMGIQEDIPALLKDSDALILSSRLEGQGIVLLEAMASGIPVIATETASVREVVLDGITGIIVEQ